MFNAHFTPGGEKVVSELIDSQLYQQRKTMSDRNTNSARKMYDTMALPGHDGCGGERLNMMCKIHIMRHRVSFCVI